ncbi:hypothetical protein [Roseixanthobacter pseudopolyaromaticivorans]|uniref:hypothetical protein n=1 Tax=Xanthobacteraceae TaxID=335928 RepID=UPI00372A0ABB
MRYAILALMSASLFSSVASAREIQQEPRQAARSQQQTTTVPDERDHAPVISEQDRLFLKLGDRGIGNG